eukprot:PhM_4_TR5537/c0_g1_i1/m.106424
MFTFFFHIVNLCPHLFSHFSLLRPIRLDATKVVRPGDGTAVDGVRGLHRQLAAHDLVGVVGLVAHSDARRLLPRNCLRRLRHNKLRGIGNHCKGNGVDEHVLEGDLYRRTGLDVQRALALRREACAQQRELVSAGGRRRDLEGLAGVPESARLERDIERNLLAHLWVCARRGLDRHLPVALRERDLLGVSELAHKVDGCLAVVRKAKRSTDHLTQSTLHAHGLLHRGLRGGEFKRVRELTQLLALGDEARGDLVLRWNQWEVGQRHASGRLALHGERRGHGDVVAVAFKSESDGTVEWVDDADALRVGLPRRGLEGDHSDLLRRLHDVVQLVVLELLGGVVREGHGARYLDFLVRVECEAVLLGAVGRHIYRRYGFDDDGLIRRIEGPLHSDIEALRRLHPVLDG